MTAILQTQESRSQAAARLIGCAAFVAAGLWMLHSVWIGEVPEHKIPIVAIGGLAGTLYFGMLVVRFAGTLLRPGSFEIHDHGLRRSLWWRTNEWRWTDLKSVDLWERKLGLVAFCEIRPKVGWPVYLVGFKEKPATLVAAVRTEMDKHQQPKP